MKNKLVVYVLSIILFVSFFSCSGGVGGGDSSFGYLSFSNGRSLPSGATFKNLSDVSLLGCYENGSEKLLASWAQGSGMEGSKVEVETGKWKFVLRGSVGSRIYESSVQMNIVADSDNVASFSMQFVGQPIYTLSTGAIILENGNAVQSNEYNSVKELSAGVAVLVKTSSNEFYAIGKKRMADEYTFEHAESIASCYNPISGAGGESTGWRIPSEQEFADLFVNKAAINSSLKILGGISSEIPDGRYWTSSSLKYRKIASSGDTTEEAQSGSKHCILPIKKY